MWVSLTLDVIAMLLSCAAIAAAWRANRLSWGVAILLATASILTSLASIRQAHAEDWHVASTSVTGDIFEIDLDTLTVWQDGSVSIKIEVDNENPMVQNFDCKGNFIILAPPNNLGLKRVVQGSSAASIERAVCALRDHVLAEAK